MDNNHLRENINKKNLSAAADKSEKNLSAVTFKSNKNLSMTADKNEKNLSAAAVKSNKKLFVAARIINRRELLIFSLYFAVSLASAFFRELINTDELWNYTFGLNISNGLLPYRDFNYLQTPFSALVNGILFVIFGKHILVMRLAGAILFTAIAIVLYKCSRLLGARPLFACIPGFMTVLLFSSNIFFEYSDFILFLLLVLVGLDLKTVRSSAAKPEIIGIKTSAYGRKKVSPIYKEPFLMTVRAQVLIGLLGGLAILSKQTYGLFVAAASWADIFIISMAAKRGWKESLKKAFFRGVGSSVPCFIFLIYLIGSSTFDDFWDMCVKGIKNFTSYYRYTTLMKENAGYFIACIALPLILVAGELYCLSIRRKASGASIRGRFGGRNISFLRGESGRREASSAPIDGAEAGGRKNPSMQHNGESIDGRKNPSILFNAKRSGSRKVPDQESCLFMSVLLIYSVFGLINMVPLANVFHFDICSIPVMLILVLLLKEYIPAIGEKTTSATAGEGKGFVVVQKIGVFLELAAYVGIIATLVFLLVYNPYCLLRDTSLVTDISGFELTFMSRNKIDEIKNIDEFIKRENLFGNEVYIVDNQTEFYNDPLNIYHKYLDMFLVGNLGTKTPLECLEESYSTNSVYLFPDDTRSNTQYPTDAVNEFKQRLFKTSSIDSFEIYRTESSPIIIDDGE